MASTLTDAASKTSALKQRREELSAIDRKVDEVMRVWAPDEAPPRKGCFPALRVCPSWMTYSKGARVATVEPATGVVATAAASGGAATAATAAAATATAAATAVSAASAVRQSGDGNRLLMRLVGASKSKASETSKLEEAMRSVALRVESLGDRVKLGRERALRAKQAGKQEDAVRELRKTKGVEKQLAAARAALDALERQQDMLAESALHRELATALQSTTAGVKEKSKGLLNFAEKAVDESIEVRDDVEDIAAVFEGIQPTFDADEDELLAELEDMQEGEKAAPVATTAVATTATTATTTAATPSQLLNLPSVPSSTKALGRQEREGLLAESRGVAHGTA